MPRETQPGAGSRRAPSRGSPQSRFLPRLSSPWSPPRASLLPVAEGGLFTSRHWTRSLNQVPSDGALSAFPPSPGTPRLAAFLSSASCSVGHRACRTGGTSSEGTASNVFLSSSLVLSLKMIF